MFQRKTFVSVLLASALALPAFAQDAAAPAAEPDQRSGIEEITITARKVTENLQDTPIAVSAINADTLESLGVEDTTDITAFAPNTYLTQTAGSSANLAWNIRGIGGAEPLLTREQGVALYMDGAYLPRVTGAVMDLVDIERVEVLRGPQGTLYGRNATGGAVNYISRKPGEEFGFKQVIGTGSYGRLNSVTRVDFGEFLPGLAASLAYLHRDRNGYVNNRLASDENDPGATNTDAFRVGIGWDVSEAIRMDYAFDYSNLVGYGQAFQLFELGGGLSAGLTASGINPANLQVSHDRMDDISLDFDGASEHTITGHNLTFEFDFGPAVFKSITTYRTWDNTEAGTELDGNALGTFTALTSPAAFAGFCGAYPFAPCINVAGQFNANFRADLFSATNERNQDQFSQELQVTGTIGEPFNYVLGFYYFDENFTENNLQQLVSAALPGLPLVPLSPGALLTQPFLLPTSAVPFFYEGGTSAWALFGNGTYTLPALDERLSLSAGVRYSKDEKTFQRFSSPATSGGDTWDNVDWDVSANFLVTDDITAYARVATGFKSGGFNLRTSLSPIAPFNEETVLAYELGFKSMFFDSRLQVNTAAFFMDYEDLQSDVFAATPTGGATSITVNAGRAEIPGFELEVLAIPLDGLTFNVSYGLAAGDYKKYEVVDNNGTPAIPTDDFKVNLAHEAKFNAYRPRHTASGGVEYATAPLGGWGVVLTARLDVRYTSELVWSALDDERGTNQPVVTAWRDALGQDGYTLLDARLTLSEIALGDRAKVRTSVYGKNITDEEYILSGIDFGTIGFAGAIFAEPATWGLDVTLEY